MFHLTGPGLALKGVMIPNHNVLMRNPSVIGTDDDALYCVTDDITCCGTPPSPGDGGSGNGRGIWYFPPPDLVAVPSSTAHTGLWYALWLTGAVLLNYRGDGSDGPPGLYRCEIRDSTGTTHQLYTCIYDSTSVTECTFSALTHAHTHKSTEHV